MEYLEEIKYRIDEILVKQKASDDVERLLSKFHYDLIARLNWKTRKIIGRTHAVGITYFLSDHYKAILFLNVRQQYLTAIFFTGDKIIRGLGKGNWVYKNDNKGSETFKIENEFTLNEALNYSLEAFNIATEWSG
ncbi:MAG TPA: hypothetical protein PLO24_08460 [Bacteroidales bacterium]|jgi:hypothetical protein|nr:hypothetical protein [Bacteroidales bacterium]HOS71434.1 hypothetical protein [Bacteroidales bacterium]HQH24914.1 hypothetical protein [Bacteroidales bacterium]HQJ82318.1 hypothetical protein [Bacteroidales bacterium]